MEGRRRRRRRRRGTVARQRTGLLGGEARSVNKGTLMNNVNMSVQNDINVSVGARLKMSGRLGALRYFHGLLSRENVKDISCTSMFPIRR